MKELSFAEADARFRLTRHGAFDAPFTKAYVLEGDLLLSKSSTGAHVLEAFGLKRVPADPGLFVVTGRLAVEGALELDEGLDATIGLVVLGELQAKALRLDMTALYVFGDARVEHAIFFESTDGTLSVAGKTECPLVVCHEGDLNIAASGVVFDSSDDGPVEPSGASDAPGSGFPLSPVSMTLTEARERLVAAVFEDEEFQSDKAFRRAAKGQPLFRPVKASAAPAVLPDGLTPLPVVEAKYATSLVSDGQNVWMAAEAAMLMFDGKRFTRVWRKNPQGSADEPPTTPAGYVFSRVGQALVAAGFPLPQLDEMQARGFGPSQMDVTFSEDGGVNWRPLTPAVRWALVAGLRDGVAMFRGGHTLSRAASLAGPWLDVRVLPEASGSMVPQCLVEVGDEVWVSLVSTEGVGAVFAVAGEQVRRLEPGATPIRRIVVMSDGVVLLGDASTALVTTDGGRSFVPSPAKVPGGFVDAVRVGEVLYAVGGQPLTKKPAKDNLGFLARSTDGGRSFELLAADVPGRLWAITAHQGRLLMAGAAKTAFAFTLPG